MRIIVVANQKGGCAKSTIVVNVAACLAEHGLKVLVIDLDAQANTSSWLASKGAGDGAMQLFTSEIAIEDLISQTSIPRVSCISASQNLSRLESLKLNFEPIEATLKNRLRELKGKSWDFVLIDTPPTLGIVTLNGLLAAYELLIPVTTHILTLSGVVQLLKTVEQVKTKFNHNLRILGFLPSRVDLRTKHSNDVLASLKDKFSENVFENYIHESIRLAEAPSFQESILTYAGSSTSAVSFRNVTQEILKRDLSKNA
jgi:chromosome partitioning protein